MEYFEKYTSNTLAGSGNQYFFATENKEKIYKSRTLYKVFSGGEYNYSFLISNIIDSTYDRGQVSHKNLILDAWKIHKMRVGITDECSAEYHKEPKEMYTLTFEGKNEKTVNPGEFFATDEIKLSPKKGEYICLEISFSGTNIPYHEESIIPSFLYDGEKWVFSKRHPFAGMVGCDRKVKAKIGFFGDSITQGIGTDINSYDHWCSILAENVGDEFSYWNLGLGFGRADDAATDGAWMYKAKKCDIVFVCFGVNDIAQRFSSETVKKNLNTIVDIFVKEGKKVILQTVPPFEYASDRIEIWQDVNNFIKTELAEKAELLFDNSDILGISETEPYMPKFGGHPNAEGCKIWGERLAEKFKEYLKVNL